MPAEQPLRTFSIIGAGVIGVAFATLLQQRGYACQGVASRSLARAQRAVARIGAGVASSAPAEVARGCRYVFITTPDTAIAAVCGDLAAARAVGPGQIVLHSSGAFNRGLLAAAGRAGALTASLHPLQSFADLEQALRRLPGTSFCIEADAAALPEVRAIVRALGGEELEVASERKALYHAAACVLSNSLAALVDVGLHLFQAAGIPRARAWPAVLPLIKGTLGNIGTVGLPQALTGPVARGDLETIRLHLRALATEETALGEAYRDLARLIIPLALAKGTLDEAGAEALRTLLDQP